MIFVDCGAFFLLFFFKTLKGIVLFLRKQELQLEMVKATQRYIEEFKKQKAEWKRQEREEMEEENKRILEYAKYQERKEADRMASARQRETAKENLYEMVGFNLRILQTKKF